eukprot:3298824-Rhodomonas_salina.1
MERDSRRRRDTPASPAPPSLPQLTPHTLSLAAVLSGCDREQRRWGGRSPERGQQRQRSKRL